ncbi:DNA cytosine methyltransferase [Sphingomonas gei]|uniref:DNA cytosine methyltransferase n=1 Tax=Sphingomonas gei TaxID=1395960 RepID=A0A4S1WZN8_9SPHN|nr:DNA cytosine methyltransferase [Sphingomonas gei]TGX49061.1 DNA cytosine methyltransferase [Sphingomonas gei]
MLQSAIITERVFRHGHLACGIGAGAKGFNMANPRVGNIQARFECAGGIDVDPGAIANFERMTGVKGTVMDLFSREQYRAFHDREPGLGWREAVPDDLREIFGRLDCLFASFPCKGFSSLLSQTASLTDKYQALNALTLRGIWLALEAYRDDPIAAIIFENVPRIATRGRWLLDQICALLRSFGYSVNEDTHDCGVLGNLAQSRKRFLLIARYPEKLPNFIYQPRHHRLRGVGEVIGKLPLPGDPRGGPMHRVPALQWKTWVRLAFVEAGKDWRSLNRLAVEDGVLRDYGIVPEADLRDNAYGVCRWNDRGPLVTSARAPGQGRFSIADPRAFSSREGSGFLGVNDWTGTVGVISSRGLPTNGGYSVADPRPGYPRSTHTNLLAVSEFDGAARCIGGAAHVAGGALSVADPRPGYGASTHRYVLGVLGWGSAKGVVTGSSRPSNGAHSVADPRINGHPASVQCGVKRWGQSAGVVTGNMWVGSGPNSVADPRVANMPRFNNTFRIVPFVGPDGARAGLPVGDPRAPDGRHVNGKYRVTGYGMVSNAVIGASTTGMGAFVVADPNYAGAGLGSHHNKMRVVASDAPSPVVTGSDRVGSGALSVADPRPRGLMRADRTSYLTQGHYGVTRWSGASGAVPAFAKNNNGPWSVGDPREVPIDDLPITLPQPDDRLVARIIALDETWHRPFTSAELAALQGLFDPEESFPAHVVDACTSFDELLAAGFGFELSGGSDATKREWTGNAVPPPSAKGIAETIGEALLLASLGKTFTLSAQEIWVKPGALALAIDNRQSAFELDQYDVRPLMGELR